MLHHIPHCVFMLWCIVPSSLNTVLLNLLNIIIISNLCWSHVRVVFPVVSTWKSTELDVLEQWEKQPVLFVCWRPVQGSAVVRSALQLMCTLYTIDWSNYIVLQVGEFIWFIYPNVKNTHRWPPHDDIISWISVCSALWFKLVNLYASNFKLSLYDSWDAGKNSRSILYELMNSVNKVFLFHHGIHTFYIYDDWFFTLF